MKPRQYTAKAREALRDLLDKEHALVWLEIEAKLADVPTGIDPHHLTTARRQLLKGGVLTEVRETTRGGRVVPVLVPTDQHRRKRAIADAAARKRLLHTRFLGWAESSQPNLIGEAGERVARASLRAALDAGYTLPNRSGGQVAALLGEPVPGGPLDDAAHLTVLVGGLPVAVTIPIEVKNIRHWIYPSADELFQLLHKAAQLQIRHPDQHLVPLLVCRRAHFTLFKMAHDLGFVVHYTGIQPILPHAEVSEEALAEVCEELGYNLVRTEGAHEKLTATFRHTLPRIAHQSAVRWAATAPLMAGVFDVLRSSSLSWQSRHSQMLQLHALAKQLKDVKMGW